MQQRLGEMMRHVTLIRVGLLVLITVWFISWAWSITPDLTNIDSGPDESLRMRVPKYIATHGTLPTGYDGETIGSIGFWSYAFYPQLLGPIVSAGFMALASIGGFDDVAMIYVARMASVMFGVIAVYFVGKSAELVTRRRSRYAPWYGLGAMLLLACWPQFAFLSAYLNNDIVGFAGVTIVTYGLLQAILVKLTPKNCLWIGVGMTVCLLGYMNALGFVVAGVALTTWLVWRHRPRVQRRILAMYLLVIPLVVAGPFFVRNAMLYGGDVLGVAAFQARNSEWEQLTDIKSQTSYQEKSHGSLDELLFEDTYGRRLATESSIATFGQMSINPPSALLAPYRLFIGMTLAAAAGLLLREIANAVAARVWPSGRRTRVAAYFASASLLTIAMSVYYTYTIDYQPQGRYTLYLLVPLVIAWTYACVRVAQYKLVRPWVMIGYGLLLGGFVVSAVELFAYV